MSIRRRVVRRPGMETILDSNTGLTAANPNEKSSAALWTGRVLTALASLFFLFDCTVKVLKLSVAMEGTARLGYPTSVVFPLGLVELACVALFVVPRTAFVGALLLTAYLGGATATHVRLGEPFFLPIVFGVVIWAGLVLRDPRLKALLLAGPKRGR
jgi:hypothetical protein